MAKISSCLLILLVFIGHHRITNADDLEVPERVLKWSVKAVKAGISLYTGDVKGFAKEIALGAKDVIDDYQLGRDPLSNDVIHITKQLDSLSIDVQNFKADITDKLTVGISEATDLRNYLNQISSIVKYIEDKFTSYRVYMKNPTDFRNGTLLNFAKALTDESSIGLPHQLGVLHDSFYNTDSITGDSVITLLSSDLQKSFQVCKRKQSLQQTLFILSNIILMADLKANTMIQSSYDIIKAIEGGEVTGEKNLAETFFTKRIVNLQESVKAAMKLAPRTLWTCDSKYEEGNTYTSLNNVFSTYIINKIHLNWIGSCIGECRSFYREKPDSDEFGCRDEELCLKEKPCDGKLWECEAMASKATVCLSSQNSDRIYDHIDIGNPRRTCPGSSINAAPWDLFSECQYCGCTCDRTENKQTDRHINARPVESDVANKFVVTGLRFKKKNNILHIQIKQGELLPGGAIDESTNDWKPVEEYKINQTISGTNYVPSEDTDYFVLKWQVKNPEWRTWVTKWDFMTQAGVNLENVDLNSLSSQDKAKLTEKSVCRGKLNCGNLEPIDYHLVTGARIQSGIAKESGKHFHLELRMTPFNITTGEIYVEESFWHSKLHHFNDDGSYTRSLDDASKKTEIRLTNLDIPRESGSTAVPTSADNQFLKFTTSSVDMDAGQSTIPFIDLQPVETNPPIPLTGAAFYHKSSGGSGGFLAMKVFTFNYEPYLQLDTK